MACFLGRSLMAREARTLLHAADTIKKGLVSVVTDYPMGIAKTVFCRAIENLFLGLFHDSSLPGHPYVLGTPSASEP